MKLKSQKHQSTLTLELEGELDVDGSTMLEERCLYEQQEGALHFVITLGAVRRVTGPGLRLLLGLARSLPRGGGSLVLCELDSSVLEALAVSGLDGSFELATDQAAAINRSRELQSTRSGESPLPPTAADEKIDFAIELLAGRGDHSPPGA